MVKNPPASAGDVGSIPVWGISAGDRNDNPFPSIFAQEIPCTEITWQATVHGVAKELDMTEATKLQQHKYNKLHMLRLSNLITFG